MKTFIGPKTLRRRKALEEEACEGQKVYGIPHPAVLVIDKTGRVSWVKVESNYRERAITQEIRAALDGLK